ncbi:unnamed protein product [Meganyctiphanes norvegica]|uniref:Uncharacterized protein n=1 Tax=Meganyctiphanes norvegica TaxID=48144 RepID=A0AAV2SBS8_MEGNR
MAFIPIERHQHPGPMVTRQFHGSSGPSSLFANDTISEYPFGSVAGGHQSNSCYNSYNGTRPVVRNIPIQFEEEESDTESEGNLSEYENVNDKRENSEQIIKKQSLESNKVYSSESENVNDEKETSAQIIENQSSNSNKVYSKETLLSDLHPTLGQGRKSVFLDLWDMNKISLQIRNWLVKSDFDVTPIVGNYQKGVSCGYIAAQAACIFRKHFTKEIEDEPIRPLILSKCLDPNLIKTANDVLGIDGTVAVSLDMVQIYEVILSLMGGSDDLSWLTVTTWNAFLEGMREGHQSKDFSVWIINTADTESSLQEGYDDRGDHWFTVVLWP